jgi:glutathione synthase/RimK-type ligase-like ATP-grasp enzyme
MSRFLGIARAAVFSPGKVDADRLILEAVAAALRRHGHEVHVVSEEHDLSQPRPGTIVFTMAQADRSLAVLREWERAGVRVINSVAGVLNCHRHRMLDCLRRAGVAMPETVLLEGVPAAWPSWLERNGGWLKRGDVHATEADDVVHVTSASVATDALARFAARGITRAVIQRHVEGPVVKFYAVGGELIGCYRSTTERAALSPPHVAQLQALAYSGARALGLDVYGGDCVVSATEGMQLIDLNDWPSYAPCRNEAAVAIARHLETQSEAIT